MTRRRVVLALASVALVVSLLQTDAAQSLLRLVGLAPAPASFLELFFADPAGHPDQVSPGQRVPVSFVLSSHGATYHVNWRVETVEGSVTRTQASGSTTVPGGESRSLTRTVTVECGHATAANARAQVRVSTEAPAQSILFWVTCPTSTP